MHLKSLRVHLAGTNMLGKKQFELRVVSSNLRVGQYLMDRRESDVRQIAKLLAERLNLPLKYYPAREAYAG